MNNGIRIPTCAASYFDRDDSTSGTIDKEQAHVSSESVACQQIISGNRCGHDKSSLKISPMYGNIESRARRPHVIEESGRRLGYLGQCFTGRFSKHNFSISGSIKTNPMLSWAILLQEDSRFIRLLYHFNDAKKRTRRRRSESLESVLFLVLSTIIYETNLYRMAAGYFDSQSRFIFYNYTHLAEKAGISLIRFKRAMRVLKELDLITVQIKNKTLDDGHIIHDETHIYLSDQVFEMLGITEEFLLCRKHAFTKHSQLEQNIKNHKKYLESFKPPVKRPKSAYKTQKMASDLLKKPKYRTIDNTNKSTKIKELYESLIYQGYTPAQAAILVRERLSDPPH
jgi:hypothetical protein